jgi:hypothetical protein
MRNTMRILYILSLIGLIVTGVAFYSTRGLMYVERTGTHTYLWTDIKSTGSNDDIAIGSAVILFFVPLLIELVQWRRERIRGVWIFCVIWFVETLLIASIEVGSILDTIFVDKNSVLAVWIICYIASMVLFIVRITISLKIREIRRQVENSPSDCNLDQSR